MRHGFSENRIKLMKKILLKNLDICLCKHLSKTFGKLERIIYRPIIAFPKMRCYVCQFHERWELFASSILLNLRNKHFENFLILVGMSGLCYSCESSILKNLFFNFRSWNNFEAKRVCSDFYLLYSYYSRWLSDFSLILRR